MKEIKLTARFEKDLTGAFRGNAGALEALDYALGLLARGDDLPGYFQDHTLEKH